MNRKAKNIIFWTVVGILIFIFIICLIFGCIRTIFGAGSAVYNSAAKVISAFGLNKSDFFKWSPFVCIGAGLVLSFLFYKKFNNRIN